MTEMHGYCFLHSETGTEGGWWAMQKDGFTQPDGYESYEGLELLREGDDFTVYADDGSVLWNGIIKYDHETNLFDHDVFRKGKWVKDPTWKQQAVDGMWVHWLQAGIDPEEWSKLFHYDKSKASIPQSRGYRRCLLKRETHEKEAGSNSEQ